MDFPTEQQIQKQQAATQMQSKREYAGQVGAANQTAPMIDTVGNVMQLMISQATELKDRTSSLANQIAGPQNIPQGPQVDSPSSLVGLLRTVSQILGEALMEAERAQRSL